MKSRRLKCITAMTLFAALAIPVRLAAQKQKEGKEHHRYKVVDIGTFGGPASFIANDPSGAGGASGVLNNRGIVVSGADTSTADPNYPKTSLWIGPDPFITHAFHWQQGVLTDLGALPGVNSSFANWISANGLIAGLSENGVIDPLLGVPETNAVLWKNGEIINLGTLEGSYESYASAVNSQGQVVGSAVNTISDPFSPFGIQNRAFVWEKGAMEDLGTLGGPDAAAWFVNERGQIAGSSYTNSTPNPVTGIPTFDPFLWEKGKMVDLGTLGGTYGVPNALNNRGQVVGQSNLAGDLTAHPFLWDRGVLTDLGTLGGSFGNAVWINDASEAVGSAELPGSQTHHAFLWNKGTMSDLGTVGSDPCSGALGINSRHQVVGFSSNCMVNLHAFLWENGQITDLNVFNRPGSGLQQLLLAYNINDSGEIAGLGVPPGVDPANVFALGHTFVLIPCTERDEGCQDGTTATNAATQSNPEQVTQPALAESPVNPALTDGPWAGMPRLPQPLWRRAELHQAQRSRQ